MHSAYRLLSLLTALIIVACSAPTPAPTPTPVAQPPTSTPAAHTPTSVPMLPITPVPLDQLAPIVIQRTPDAGAELAPNQPVELVFDRPMDQASVERAFAIAPAASGTLSWPDARTLRFTPNNPFARATLFKVTLASSARAVNGPAISEQLQFNFPTAGFLEVGQVIPADGTSDVQIDSAISVLFNRPVVPLVSVEQQAALPQPLSFDPPIQGSGEWVGTAIYLFRPAEPLAGGTTYTARVNAALVDLDGNPLSGEFVWRFSTARPQVLSVQPSDAATQVRLDSTIRVQFNQPIDPNTAQAAFSLQDSNGVQVPGNFEILRDTLVFTPAARLAYGTAYRIGVSAALTGQGGGAGLVNNFLSAFTTVPLPRVIETLPADGSSGADPNAGLLIRFSAPISPSTVMQNIRITPEISAAQLITWYNEYDASFMITPLASNTDYTLEIGPGISDPYGTTIGETKVVRFRTGVPPPPPPYAGLIVPNFVATYDAARPVQVAVASINQPQIELTLNRLDVDTLTNLGRFWGQEQLPGTTVRAWTAALPVGTTEPVFTILDLDPQNQPLQPGIYILQMRYNQDYGVQQHVLIVSPINLTVKAGERDALVWATDLRTGAPVPNLALELYDSSGTLLGNASTDANGVALAQFTRTSNNGLVALSRNPVAVMGSDWTGDTLPWAFNLPGMSDLPELTAHVYTDRPIYRPGQDVFFKALVRAEDDATFRLPANLGPATLTVYNSAGEKIYERELTLSASGTLDDRFTLDAAAATGGYNLSLTVGGASFYTNFQVAAYRPPEFEVQVSLPTDEIVRGTPVQASVAASYFFGGPVANVPVQYNVLAERYRFTPEWAGRYNFDDADDPFICWECWWYPTPPPQPLIYGSGTTDGQGRLLVDLPAELLDANGQPVTRSVQLTIEATATGRDNQAISGRTTIVRHAGQVYAGLAAQNLFGKAGESQQIDIVTASSDGDRLGNRTVEVEFVRVAWESNFVERDGGGYWESYERRTVVGTQTVTTDPQAQARVNFTPAEGGAYQVVAKVRDDAGREQRAAIFLWVAGDGYMPWPRPQNNQITLIADRTSYRPGETADILVPSPFQQEHWALITVERGRILRHEVRRVSGNTLQISQPLGAADAPNVYVSVVLVSPPDPESGLADFKIGMLPLTVVPDAQALRVTFTPNVPQSAGLQPGQAMPGDTVTFDLLVTDQSGAPAAAELSLDLVDKAVLSLQPRTPDAIREAFYGRRPLGIFTSSALGLSGNRTVEQVRADDEKALQNPQEARGGDMREGVAAGAPMPTAAPSADAEMSAPGTGSAAAPQLTVREEFADTAFWQAVVTTDASGRASVSIKLPDNLTTWVLRGVAATADTKVGEGLSEVVATKPLLIRPVTPRFLVVGDTVELSANVSNNTDTALNAEVGLEAPNLTLTDPITQAVSIPAKGETQVRWTASVSDVTSVPLVFRVVSGQYGDASKPRLATGPDGSLPVYRYSVPETVGTGGQIEQAGARTEVIGLPPRFDDRNGELTIRIDPSLASGLRDGLKALEYEPYDSTEAVISRFLPNLLTAEALKKAGIADPDLEAQLPTLISTGLDRLYLYQMPDGGWGWWGPTQYYNQSNPHITAYVIFGMIRARDAGYSVRQDVIDVGLSYLESQLSPAGLPPTQWETFAANRQTWLLYVLGEAGRPDATRLADMFETRAKLGVYARALLALALERTAPGDARIRTILADLNTVAVLSATGAHWEEPVRDWWSMGTSTRSTAMVLAALVRLDPQNQLLPNVVRWLMVARKDSGWSTTQETVWSLIALSEWLAQSSEMQTSYDYGVWLNGNVAASGRFTPADLRNPVVLRVAVADLLSDQGNRLTIGRGDGQGRLYYTAHLRNFLPVEDVRALSRGVSVSRRYTLASCTEECPEVREVKLGEIVRVDIAVTAPSDLHYLRVEDPLPAGFEAVDTSLATTSLLAQGAQLNRMDDYWWWWRWYNRSELRDEKVALFADFLGRGSYVYSYTMRAVQPGEFRAIPTTASETYFPEVYGRGDGAVITVVR